LSGRALRRLETRCVLPCDELDELGPVGKAEGIWWLEGEWQMEWQNWESAVMAKYMTTPQQ